MPYPSVYNNILKVSSKYYSNQPSLPLTIASQFLWFNYFIKIHNKVHRKFLKKKKTAKFVKNIFEENGKFKTWEQITGEFKIYKILYFK